MSQPKLTKEQLKELSLFSQQSYSALQDSERWFPEVAHSLTHHTLAFVGEAGEFANVVKKLERGSSNMSDASVRLQMIMELTDAYVYMLNIAGLLNVDLSKSYDMVRAQNEKRFGGRAHV